MLFLIKIYSEISVFLRKTYLFSLSLVFHKLIVARNELVIMKVEKLLGIINEYEVLVSFSIMIMIHTYINIMPFSLKQP